MASVLTRELIEAAIKEVLETGETWQLGPTMRRISLERLQALLQMVIDGAALTIDGVFGSEQKLSQMFSVAAIEKPLPEDTE